MVCICSVLRRVSSNSEGVKPPLCFVGFCLVFFFNELFKQLLRCTWDHLQGLNGGSQVSNLCF